MNSTSLIGHTGKRRQHPVYLVNHGGKPYTVTPGTNEVTRVVEARMKGRIVRRVERIGGPLFDELIAQALEFAKERD